MEKAKRSCHASQEGLKQIRREYNAAGLTQEGLAETAGVSRSTVSSFFAGRAIDRNNFVELCTALNLNWEDVIERPTEPEASSAEIDAIVQEIREKIRPIVHEKCSTMKVLDMMQKIELTGEHGIYTNVNILERVTGRDRLEIAEILRRCGVEEFERFGLSQVTEKRVPGLEAVEQHRKLMVLGKPGAGKSTFLKYLAMQCIEGNFQANRIPIFITLKDFAEAKDKPTLATYITDQYLDLDVKKAALPFKQGRALVLLDGLDEVREEDYSRILSEIREFSDGYYKNNFVITCRIAAKEYTFERFTEVEVADFDEEQITIFAQNWFRQSDPTRVKRFIQKLKENRPIRELASSPLLLTLLCLVFGENADFPANRSELYKEGLDVLLKKWDGKRNIQRDQLYKNLSIKRKEDLLSQIALKTFQRKEYFFKQKTLEAYISDFIRNLPNVDSDPEILRMDSEAVLKSIEAQHGLFVERAKSIYSFSHLTFQEYFVSKETVETSTYENLVQHLTEKRWREVFLLTTSMMRNADDLLKLMKQKTNKLVASDETMQNFLREIDQKSISAKLPYKLAGVRALYFALDLAIPLDLAIALDLPHDCALELVYSHEPAHSRNRELNRLLNLALDLTSNSTHTYSELRESARKVARFLYVDDRDFEDFISHPDNYPYYISESNREIIERYKAGHNRVNAYDNQYYNSIENRTRTLIDIYTKVCEAAPGLKTELRQLKKQLPNTSYQFESYINNEQTWIELQDIINRTINEPGNSEHEVRFSDEQKQLLQQYYDANKLLIDCLNSDCYVSRDVRQEIEETLLLPISEIEARKNSRE
ncbi:NACHT C-terminal helical domain 2-containing protein [Phormidesmis sp. 146-12]